MSHDCEHPHVCVKTIDLLPGHNLSAKQVAGVAAEVVEKLRLERIFSRELNGLFNRTAGDFRTSYAVTGNMPSREDQVRAYELLFQNQLRRVHESFAGILREAEKEFFVDMEMKQEDDEEGIDELVAFALLALREQVARERAEVIVDTNERQMNVAVGQARMQLTEEGQPTDSRSLAAAAAAILLRLFRRRTQTIAQTETQEAAEAAKLVEAEVLAGLTPFPLRDRLAVPARPAVEPRIVQKTWTTIGDDRVRPSHVAVNGTTLPENGVFTVGGGQLRFPTDRALGAPIATWINCRCSAVYSFSRMAAGLMFLRQRKLLSDTKELRDSVREKVSKDAFLKN